MAMQPVVGDVSLFLHTHAKFSLYFEMLMTGMVVVRCCWWQHH